MAVAIKDVRVDSTRSTKKYECGAIDLDNKTIRKTIRMSAMTVCLQCLQFDTCLIANRVRKIRYDHTGRSKARPHEGATVARQPLTHIIWCRLGHACKQNRGHIDLSQIFRCLHRSPSYSTSLVFEITTVDYDNSCSAIGLMGTAELCNSQGEGSFSCFIFL
jgi:hypothetical protein